MASKRLLLALVPALVLTGCAAAGSPTPASSAASQPPASAARASSAAAAKTLSPVKAAYVAIGAHTLPIWLAVDKGLFKRQGLDVELTYVQGSVTAMPAMAAGDLHIIEATPGASVQAQLRGQDTVALATHIPYADYRLMAVPEVKTLQDLKGKVIGQTKPGTIDDVIIQNVLKQKGFTPGKDVSLTYLDSQPAILAALEKKLIQAASLSPPNDVQAEKNGAHEVLDILKERFPYPIDGVISTRKYVREHPEEVNAFLKAYLQAVRYIKSNPDETKRELAERTKLDDQRVIDEGYRVMVEALADNPLPTTEGIATVLPLFEGGQGKNPADFVDPAPLARALQELGAAK